MIYYPKFEANTHDINYKEVEEYEMYNSLHDLADDIEGKQQ